MKKTKKKLGEIDFILFAIILTLVCFGVLMVYSASSYSAAFKNNNAEFYLWKQLMWASLGVISMIVTMNVDYHKYKRYTGKLMIITIVLLLLVFVFPPVNGARRWISLGPLGFQPSEIAKYVVVLFIAMFIDRKGEKIKSFKEGIFPCLAVAGVYAGLILAEKNLSITAITMMVALVMLLISGVEIKKFAKIFLPIIALGVIFIVFEDYRLRRVIGFMDPWKDAQGDGYQLIQSLLALGSGGLTGVGIGQSRQKCFYIPEPHTDFIFAIVGEELGFIGCAFVVILFILFLWRGLIAILKSKDIYGTMLATGIVAIITLQAIINIAVVTVSMPTTGVPLPFISYGGSSLVINMTAMGILLNITRQNNYKSL
ncbi:MULTISPECIES: stage V sporulation protein E [Clostridium]|uniref:Probable peptidoglycan glycosyltransferase FtsW n=1 Tax=Clostridium senegalense TaxID=1465809 RepID=A0A6M0GY65_9CLOT|nr:MULTISPECIES: stage V sporulation protein E [Clostridium]NEU03536.1 stage V sporulation protein E [Clostridium senegalense]